MSPTSSGSTKEPFGSDSFGGLPRLLDEVGVRWCVAGALAAMRYRATSRMTDDVDLVVEWDAALLDVLQEAGWDVTVAADPGEPPHLVRARREINVDLLVAQTEYQSRALDRAVDHWLTVEDVLVHKLIAGRPRDRDDIAEILATGITFDEGYVDRWSAAWEVTDRWREARGAAS